MISASAAARYVSGVALAGTDSVEISRTPGGFVALNCTTLSAEVDCPTVHAAGREKEKRPFGSVKRVPPAPAALEPAAVVPPGMMEPVADPAGRVPTMADAEPAATVEIVMAEDAGRVPLAAEPAAAVGAVVPATLEPVTELAGRVAVVAELAAAAALEGAGGGVSVALLLPPHAVSSAAMISSNTDKRYRRCIERTSRIPSYVTARAGYRSRYRAVCVGYTTCRATYLPPGNHRLPGGLASRETCAAHGGKGERHVRIGTPGRSVCGVAPLR
jgi:hypothetical protein